MARNVAFQVLRGVQGNIPTLSMGEMYFATDTGNLFFGTPGFGKGYVQIGDTTNVNDTLVLLLNEVIAMKRMIGNLVSEDGSAKIDDFDVETFADSDAGQAITTS